MASWMERRRKLASEDVYPDGPLQSNMDSLKRVKKKPIKGRPSCCVFRMEMGWLIKPSQRSRKIYVKHSCMECSIEKISVSIYWSKCTEEIFPWYFRCPAPLLPLCAFYSLKGLLKCSCKFSGDNISMLLIQWLMEFSALLWVILGKLLPRQCYMCYKIVYLLIEVQPWNVRMFAKQRVSVQSHTCKDYLLLLFFMLSVSYSMG